MDRSGTDGIGDTDPRVELQRGTPAWNSSVEVHRETPPATAPVPRIRAGCCQNGRSPPRRHRMGQEIDPLHPKLAPHGLARGLLYSHSAGTPPPTPTYRYRSSLGWGQMERLLEYKQAYHLESNWLLQGDPELYVVVTSHAAMPTDATKPLFQSRVRFGAGKPDNTNWHTISVDLIRWNQEYGNFMNLKFYEADGTAFTTGTLTFAGKTYGYTYPHENDDLGNWTYSFNDAALVNGYSGHGVNKWGANTGSLTFISDYLIP